MPSPLIVDGELILHGTIGQDWFGDGIVASDVIQALADVGRQTDVTVRVNSGGGIATEGAAIYAALRNHAGDVNIVVEGIAASAASIVAMAGDSIVMSQGSVMMIHEPFGFTAGTASDHQKSIDALNTLATAMAGVYAERTGRDLAAERQIMTNETWMTAADAVAQGYADKVAGDEPANEEIAPFNYALYARAPKPLVAAARSKGWGIGKAAVRPAETTAINETVALLRELLAARPKAEVTQPEIPAEEAAIVPEETAMTEAEKKAAADAKAAADKIAADTQAAAITAAVDKAVADAVPKAAADAVAADRKRGQEIEALCSLAGFPSKAMAFANAGKTVAEVQAELTTLKAANPAGEISARHRPNPAAGVSQGKAHAVNPAVIYADRSKARAARQPGRLDA